MQREERNEKEEQGGKGGLFRKISYIALGIIVLAGALELFSCLKLGCLEEVVQMGIVEALLVLGGILSLRVPLLGAPLSGAAFAIAYTTNYAETTAFHWPFWVQAGGAALLFLGGMAGWLLGPRGKGKKGLLGKRGFLFTALSLLLIAGVSLGSWRWFYQKDASQEGFAKRTLWAVPKVYDQVESERPGRVEELTYQTRAYGTDGREVEKRALVYLPADYDGTPMNILYLMHGTGDDEEYWLRTCSYNKTMLDRMIERGDIEPLIVVTPTFYVEQDCMDGLDTLTYSFQEELRNDLMVAVEGKYATFAKGTEEEDFKESRDHRAFAGLSRGAVTTLHSALCGCLDYFSWFGTFSGSRTDPEYFLKTLQTESFGELPIHYLYVASGTFDFALPRQIQDYEGLLGVEKRLKGGVNTSFDIFPMRYHSMGNWHLALYNFLLKIF